MSTQLETEPFTIASTDFEPAYLALHRSGELQRRIAATQAWLSSCCACPRQCGANRLHGQTGFCDTGRYAMMSSAFPHMGEEPCLRGWKGSGTIFLSRCNLGCVFCQNFDISQAGVGEAIRPEHLANVMLQLQAMGCHNINLVTPSHVVPQILESIAIAADHGLHLPIVYNTSAYESLETLRMLDGVIDMYMPDFKFWDPQAAARYLQASDYPDVARNALKEMHRQVGPLKMDENHVARRGLLVRHLLIPGFLTDTERILRFLAEELSPDTYVNLMAQYHPSGRVSTGRFSEINRSLNNHEYAEALKLAYQVGLWRLDDQRPHWSLQAWW
ncbi:MAG: radical SAM protein [Chloroflexaceae bacterium]|nr:radical SAM protein [Chloroflexaceae bacterium]